MIKSAVSIRPLVQALGPSHADPDNGPADVGTDPYVAGIRYEAIKKACPMIGNIKVCVKDTGCVCDT